MVNFGFHHKKQCYFSCHEHGAKKVRDSHLWSTLETKWNCAHKLYIIQIFQTNYPFAVVTDIKKPKNPLNRRCPICVNTASAFSWQFCKKASVSWSSELSTNLACSSSNKASFSHLYHCKHYKITQKKTINVRVCKFLSFSFL